MFLVQNGQISGFLRSGNVWDTFWDGFRPKKFPRKMCFFVQFSASLLLFFGAKNGADGGSKWPIFRGFWGPGRFGTRFGMILGKKNFEKNAFS